MIVRIKLPERVGFMALHSDESGVWVPITGRLSSSAALAQQLCVSDVRSRLVAIAESLTARITTVSADVARLLDQPQNSDKVAVGGFERGLDSEGALIIDEWQLDEAVRRGLEQLTEEITRIDDLSWKTLEKILDSDTPEIAANFERLIQYIRHNPMPLFDRCEAEHPEQFHELALLLVQLFRDLRVEGSEVAIDDSELTVEGAPANDNNGETS